VRVIKRRPLLEFAAKHPAAYAPLDSWYRVARRARWRDITDVRQVFPAADGNVLVSSGRSVTVFNIGGNKYRLVVAIHYNTQMVFVLRVLTHKEYARESWKDQL
jgi:mRNA interferase HigB